MPVSNPASFSSIKAEFGGSNNFSQYYRGGPYVSSGAPAGISATADGLRMSQFNGVSNFSATLSQGATTYTTNPKTMVTTAHSTLTASPSGGTAPYTYAWSRVSGALVTLTNTTAQTCTFTFTDDAGSGGGSFVAQCVVTDATGKTTTKQITATF